MLRRLIPKQCELKNECNIALLSNKHVLIRASTIEDYVNLLSKPVFYIIHRGWTYPIRTLKWDPMFNPKEETTTIIAWISFLALPLDFFGEESCVFISSSGRKANTRRHGNKKSNKAKLCESKSRSGSYN